jgi:ergothioneine biosynthesis protein EgtB
MQPSRPGRATVSAAPAAGHIALAARYAAVRAQTLRLAEPLSAEDCQVQSMPDASPVKWHLAHVTWFFETFVLERFERQFQPFHPAFRVLFNSYYHAVGDQHPRARRGQVTRPGLHEVLAWRAQVDERMAAVLATDGAPGLADLVTLGLQHEQQHQELLLTDVKHLLAQSPLHPVYRSAWPLARVAPLPAAWLAFEGGTVQVGHAGDGFAFDNETPRHTQLLRPYALANRLVTHGEWAAFVADGGYRDPRWWLSAGWDWVRAGRVDAPLYWHVGEGGRWDCFTLHGRVPIDDHTPVTHISYFEADAFARWKAATDHACAGARLPTEFEWEAAVAPELDRLRAEGNFVESGALHPMPPARPGPEAPVRPGEGLVQALGDVWEWTASSYSPYPGYQPWAGAVGEYNGKFMVNQTVLRGGSCATPADHVRASYRNFFPTEARWQFTGLRLARDLPTG